MTPICSLKSAATLRPVAYSLLRMLTLTSKPVFVVAFAISSWTRDTGENDALTGTCQVRKQAMLDRIVLRRVRWIVRDPHLRARVLHQLFGSALQR